MSIAQAKAEAATTIKNRAASRVANLEDEIAQTGNDALFNKAISTPVGKVPGGKGAKPDLDTDTLAASMQRAKAAGVRQAELDKITKRIQDEKIFDTLPGPVQPERVIVPPAPSKGGAIVPYRKPPTDLATLPQGPRQAGGSTPPTVQPSYATEAVGPVRGRDIVPYQAPQTAAPQTVNPYAAAPSPHGRIGPLDEAAGIIKSNLPTGKIAKTALYGPPVAAAAYGAAKGVQAGANYIAGNEATAAQQASTIPSDMGTIATAVPRAAVAISKAVGAKMVASEAEELQAGASSLSPAAQALLRARLQESNANP
jgi:hypothetical protein